MGRAGLLGIEPALWICSLASRSLGGGGGCMAGKAHNLVLVRLTLGAAFLCNEIILRLAPIWRRPATQRSDHEEQAWR